MVDARVTPTKYSEQNVLNKAFDNPTEALKTTATYIDPLDGNPYSNDTKVKGGLTMSRISADGNGFYTHVGLAPKGAAISDDHFVWKFYNNGTTYTGHGYATGAWTGISGYTYQ